MTDQATTATVAGTPFFLRAAGGQRLCIYTTPPPGVALRGAVLYVPPFAEEMNKVRRMAALQARALAAAGVAVLQIDLYGCGDSSGDFADARWDLWLEDLAHAHGWLANATGLPVGLLGVRLGALLALDHARQTKLPGDSIVLWQPVVSGRAYLTQFLRLRLASVLINGDDEAAANDGRNDQQENPGSAGGTQALRAVLRRGQNLEVAGYELAPALANAIDALSATELAPDAAAVTWFEVMADASRAMPPNSARIQAGWLASGVRLQACRVTGPSFWTTQEITECAALIGATVDVFCGVPA